MKTQGYQIEVKNHETGKSKRLYFDTKKEANLYLTQFDKRGYDYFDKENRSIEYCKCY